MSFKQFNQWLNSLPTGTKWFKIFYYFIIPLHMLSIVSAFIHFTLALQFYDSFWVYIILIFFDITDFIICITTFIKAKGTLLRSYNQIIIFIYAAAIYMTISDVLSYLATVIDNVDGNYSYALVGAVIFVNINIPYFKKRKQFYY
ncbi:hypothetical protein SDC9_103591 [bioreactor metagenome]|uniref:Uncharacterized protein n=1 Tax=bioreactor metagenome TaxID=1076179 RepID=A0A645AVA0_9ZZZZ|nr:hypothetical protein [Oscillospiraceae bacterium]